MGKKDFLYLSLWHILGYHPPLAGRRVHLDADRTSGVADRAGRGDLLPPAREEERHRGPGRRQRRRQADQGQQDRQGRLQQRQDVNQPASLL